MLKMLLTDWHPMRVLRLVISLLFFGMYFTGGESVLLAGAFFFGFQALFNTGCCGSQGCGTGSLSRGNDLKSDDVLYKEIR